MHALQRSFSLPVARICHKKYRANGLLPLMIGPDSRVPEPPLASLGAAGSTEPWRGTCFVPLMQSPAFVSSSC